MGGVGSKMGGEEGRIGGCGGGEWGLRWVEKEGGIGGCGGRSGV